MTINVRRWAWSAAGIAAAGLLAVAGTAAAGPVQDPGPVAPNQSFVGFVHGTTGDSRILVVCDGPVSSAGRTGHPLAGQRVEARSVPGAPSPDTGFTGSRGTKLGVSLTPGSGPQVELRFYLTRVEIPRDVLVPCSGTGLVSFVPDPVSPTARRATVKVEFATVLT